MKIIKIITEVIGFIFTIMLLYAWNETKNLKKYFKKTYPEKFDILTDKYSLLPIKEIPWIYKFIHKDEVLKSDTFLLNEINKINKTSLFAYSLILGWIIIGIPLFT